MHRATHTLLVSCSRFNYGFGVSFAISSRVPSHSWAQLSQGLSTKSPPLPSSPPSMSSAPLSVPFNLFCQLVRHSASVRRALLHFFFLLIVVAAEMSPLFLGLFSTFSLRLFGLLRHFEGRPLRSMRPRPLSPSSRRLSVRPLNRCRLQSSALRRARFRIDAFLSSIHAHPSVSPPLQVATCPAPFTKLHIISMTEQITSRG